MESRCNLGSPAELPRSERNRGVVLGEPGRMLSCTASPGSRTWQREGWSQNQSFQQIIDGISCGEEAALAKEQKSGTWILGKQQRYFKLKLHSFRLSSHLETKHPLTCTTSHLPLSLPAPTSQSKPQSALARIKELPEIPSMPILRACKLHIFACWLSLREQGQDIPMGLDLMVHLSRHNIVR